MTPFPEAVADHQRSIKPWPGKSVLSLIVVLWSSLFLVPLAIMAPSIFSFGGVVPMEVGEALCAVVVSFLLLPWWKSGGIATRCALAMLFLFLAVCWSVCWCSNERVQFCRALGHVRLGMTREQVRQKMSAYEQWRGEGPSYLGYHHSDEGHYNADYGFIQLRGGRVASISFSPD